MSKELNVTFSGYEKDYSHTKKFNISDGKIYNYRLNEDSPMIALFNRRPTNRREMIWANDATYRLGRSSRIIVDNNGIIEPLVRKNMEIPNE